MSRRDLIRMTPDEVDEFLGGRRTMNLATYGPSGRIHLVAMWYGFHGGDIVIETFAKSQKVQNLRRDARFTFIVEDGDRYGDLVGVTCAGTAEIVDDPAVVLDSCKSVLARYEDLSGDDLDGAAALMANKRVAVVLHIDDTVSWDHRKLGGGY